MGEGAEWQRVGIFFLFDFWDLDIIMHTHTHKGGVRFTILAVVAAVLGHRFLVFYFHTPLYEQLRR
jgi:hypothetical protein